MMLGLSTLVTSVTGLPSMAKSFSFAVGVAVAVSAITGIVGKSEQRDFKYPYSGLHVQKNNYGLYVYMSQ